ncbi:HlyC/CorC family transporter [Oceaniglobus ichthyenteri]|uniref:HlyC/CorC family transporter n=1 Tax=Oceaniglobus ichthyenteri TaxID=2136177 RepID=UPI000D34A871|nr:HlyC/CorC family transporter [Oceaniglobus ichthyenteri]
METATTVLDVTFWVTCGIIFFLLLTSAFFSGTETALTAASRGRLRSNADRGDKGAVIALKIKEDDERFIGAILMGNNIANVVATSLATAVLTKLFGVNGVVYASLVMTALILIFAEVLPKTFAITRPDIASSFAAPIVIWVIRILSPLVTGVQFVVRASLRLVGVRIDPNSNVLAVREEIAGALNLGHSEGVVEKEDRDRILGALDLAERTVEEIMLHRSKIKMIDVSVPPQEMLEQCLISPHTRLPIYRGTQEEIVGVIHAKDLLRAMYTKRQANEEKSDPLEDFDIMDVAMKPYFVPETTTLDDQMRQFLRRHTHFALVVDEYGALQGLITLEDILEEIVGEITDEFDVDSENPLRKADNGDFLVDGAMTIRDFNRATEWSLPDDEANTVAGLVIHEAQTIPTQGQVFSFHGYRFEVAQRKDNRITRLKIRAL